MGLYNTPMLTNIGVSFNYIHLHILSETARTPEADMRHEVYFFKLDIDPKTKQI